MKKTSPWSALIARAPCPFCNNGLSAGQFAQVIADLEEAMDARIDELMTPAPPQGCACKASCR